MRWYIIGRKCQNKRVKLRVYLPNYLHCERRPKSSKNRPRSCMTSEKYIITSSRDVRDMMSAWWQFFEGAMTAVVVINKTLRIIKKKKKILYKDTSIGGVSIQLSLALRAMSAGLNSKFSSSSSSSAEKNQDMMMNDEVLNKICSRSSRQISTATT